MDTPGNGEWLRFVPDELKTLDLCLGALHENALALEHVPVRFRTRKICADALRKRAGF